MPRTTDATLIAAVQAPNIQLALFAVLTFSSATVYVWSGLGSVVWQGQMWTGIGSLLGIQAIEDGSTVEARGIALTLSGFDPVLLPDCMSDFVLGGPAIVYLGIYSGGSLYANPFTCWLGCMDQPSIEVSAETGKITINCENAFVSMNTPVDRRYTIEDQQALCPGDLGMAFVDGLQNLTTFWMQYPNNSANV
jgi:hypothetical protein